MTDFGFGNGSVSHHAVRVESQGNLDHLGSTDGLDWNLLPNETFAQPLLFDDYQGFANHSYQHCFSHSLPTLPERSLYELEEFSPLSTQTSNETSTTSDQHPKRRSIRKRRIENGYHCSEPYCQEAFDTAGELTKHCYRKHTPESAWPFACPVCGKRFYDKRDYRRHENVERKRAYAVASAGRSVPGSPERTSQEKEANDGDIAETMLSLKQSTLIVEPEKRHSNDDNEKKSLEFTRPNDHHTSPITLLSAATSDLKRFINLGANHIMIKAIIPSQNESMNISSTHTLTKTKAPETDISDVLSQSQTLSPPLRPQPETSKPDRTATTPVKINRQEATSLPISAVKPLSPVVNTVTLTFRSRPSFPRSLTHPAGLRMVGCF